MNLEKSSFGTKAVHAGQDIDPITGSLLSPMYMTSTYCWDPPTRERYLSGDKDGIFTYGRSRNPTQNELQKKIAMLEGAENCLVTASGMAAISLAVMNAVHSGEHMIAYKTIYSGSFKLFTQIFEEMKIDVTFVDDISEETLRGALRENTKVIYAETVFNPTLGILDLEAFAGFAKANNLVSIVDSTFTTPYLLRPLEYGVDVVVHSTTKYINGHGDLIGGAIAGKFDYIDKIRSSTYQELGPVPSPFSCWLMLRGLKTLHLRMRQHCENAQAVAEWLEKQPKIEKVIYPGLKSHPEHALATKLFAGRGYGGMVSFVVKGGLEAATKMSDNVEIAKYCVSLGDCDTLIEQPPLMTHGMLAREVREAMGIDDGLVRLSVGIEDVNDIIESLQHALSLV
ncbi:aminotransferase class I/II-fold pyridoxal phosphate-dependent enzyme [Eubacteriales bacterium OttesenSCG-928-K08]|nr:aminotransferase class I/II-fold pyridoxal phosphate-dependent enzyme [Eubacteriales bacterium OttesenSCG-928-K08]